MGQKQKKMLFVFCKMISNQIVENYPKEISFALCN